MLIRKLKFDNNPILGNMELDFVNHSLNTPYDTIILVGENGVGKSTILSAIAKFMGGYTINQLFSSFEFTSDGHIVKYMPNGGNNNELRTIDGTSSSFNRGKYSTGGIYFGAQEINSDINDPRYYGCILSKPRSDFEIHQIKQIGTSELDSSKFDDDAKSDQTSLKQLLIDLDTQDAEEFKRLHKTGLQPDYNIFKQSSKLSRFENAFNHFFDIITFSDIHNDNYGNKEVFFKKNGTEIPIDSLSTGEKQIVYRGIYLLRNMKSLKGGVLLIDEPELSLHPRWQNKILKYYQDLFTDHTTGKQLCQIFIATHSERILTAAFNDKEKNTVIVLKDNNGAVTSSLVNAPAVLPQVTCAEITFQAFNVLTVDYHIELYAKVQSISGHKLTLTARISNPNTPTIVANVKQTDEYIINHAAYQSAVHEKIHTFSHPNGHSTTYNSLPTFVRNRIKAQSIILPDVKIGNNVVIAAGSIITKDIPDNCVAGGVPAKVIGNFDDLVEKRRNLKLTASDAPELLWNEFFEKRKSK